jgi:HEAT repeat protein
MQEAERQSLLADLVHADEERRRLAVEQLPRLASADALARLVEMLGDACWRVRKATSARLASHPDRVGGSDAATVAALALAGATFAASRSLLALPQLLARLAEETDAFVCDELLAALEA